MNLATKLKCAIQAKIAVADKIALKLDLDMVDNICKNLKYEFDSQIVDRPIEAKYFSREQEDDETFVWAGFVKPGAHSFVVEDPLVPVGTLPYQKSILVGPRKSDLAECVTLTPQDQWQIRNSKLSGLDSASLFSNWKRDTRRVNEVCLSIDCHYIGIERLVGSSSEALDCYNVLKDKDRYGKIMKIHTVLAAHGDTFPCIDLRGWNTFV